jgi:uncharacterized membrane protein
VRSVAAGRILSVPLLIAALAGTLALGAALKLPCTDATWASGRPYTRLCYTDLVPLYRTEGLSSGKVPYLEAPNEYPVLTGMTMWLTSLASTSTGSFFAVNALGFLVLAGVTAVVLRSIVGRRALFFALAPTLALGAFVNWDLLPVTLTTLGIAAFLRDRDARAGVWLGLGAAAKIYPAIFLIPLALQRVREGRGREARTLVGWAVGAWAALNLPVAIASFDRWSYVLRFNALRAPTGGSSWFVVCRIGTGSDCGPSRWIGLAGILGAVAILGWVVPRTREAPVSTTWTLSLPLLAAVLLTTKVYSPQYSLWLLPLFALALPDVRTFLAFEVADVTVYLLEFSWLGRQAGFGGASWGWLAAAVVARAALLTWIVVLYVRRSRTREVDVAPDEELRVAV